MANLQFSGDLLDDMLFRAGEPTDSTSDFYAQALVYLNRAYQAVWMGGSELDPSINEKWLWLKKDTPGVLTLEPKITTGTVDVSNNSTGITFSSAPSKDLDNWFFKVDDHPDVFRISAHTAAAAAATLDAVYTGTDDSAASYKVFKLEYDLASDVLNIVAPMRAYQESKSYIDGMDLNGLERRWPLRLVQGGMPEAFSMVTPTKVRFSHYGGDSSTDLIRLEYDYLYQPDDLTDSGSEEPVIPRQYRRILSDAALFLLFMDKNDDRADGAALMARQLLRAMKVENRARLTQFSRTMGKIMPRQWMLPEFLEPLRTETGLVIG